MTLSLRARLLLGAGLIALVLVVAALATTRSTRANLVAQVDGQLRAAGPQLTFDGDRPQRPGGSPGASPRLSSLYIGLVTSAGDLVTVATPDLTGSDAPLPVLGPDDPDALRDGASVTLSSTDPDVRYRMQARGERAGTLTVLALPLDDVDQAMRRLSAVLALAGAVVLGTLALVVWWVIRLGVRPVQRMSEAAQAIAAGDLSRRVPQGEAGTEAGELGDALNGMLGRIEDAFDQRTASEARLRQFVADASHELRTPVTTIRGYAELYRSGALAQPGELDEAMRRTEAEAVRMGSLVDDLLQLARLDQGRPLAREPVDLAVLARDAVADAAAVAPDRTIAVEAVRAVVEGDELQLRQVLANLVANALAHAPGASITVRTAVEADAAVLEVVDDGPGMAEADAARAFERFYRADAARTRHQGGSGLGLAIVDATVRAHGGTTALRSSPGAGTTVRITLRLLPDPDPLTA
ncbi:MAG: sensor histidine kinase [Acidimicrobiales bacterium]